MSKISTLVLSLTLITGSSVVAADQLAEGKELFSSTAKPIACAVCHTLEDAGAVGTIGPDLNELQPDANRIRKTMLEGMGAMPSFADSLTESERESIIEYVVTATAN